MSRLADYFVVVGYDHEKKRNGTGSGKILQRFPENDWEDCPFTMGLELFCQPTGYALSTQQQQPAFYVAVLTDIDADRHYCATFTFHETVAMTPSKPDDVDADDHDTTIVHHSLMYAPKSLVLVSRLDYFEAFRNCLGIIYTVYMENMQVQIETLVGNILGCIQVPPPGGPQVRFSIGAGDRQALQPPLSSTLPVSHDSVALFFDQMGINNAILVFCAALTDNKILFYSNSYCRLTAACRAIIALYYPLKYSYVYIPILPVSLLEVLTTPTPFIAGVHASLKDQVMDLLDVILVDLDGGDIRIPECVTVPLISEPILSRTKKCLNMILLPDLLSADYAFPPSPRKVSAPIQRDKEIRAVFIRMFAELFTGYRSSLALIRIHPEPFITFHKADFLGQRGMVEDQFVMRVFEGMGFSAFVAERGPPYRVCDIFDEVYAMMPEQLRLEQSDPEKVAEHIKELAHQLYLNECPNPQPYVAKIPKPTEGAHCRIHQLPFPSLNVQTVQDIIEEGMIKHNLKNKLTNIRPSQSRIVPMGAPITSASERQRMVENHARRLEVLRNCVNFIFDNRISDAKIIFPAVLRALKSRVARLTLTQELSHHVHANRAMLEHQQFDLIVRLLNCALQNESSMDENGVAYNILPLATAFCRKLCTGVIQFSYTCIQDHAVWGSLSFWEQAFYQDVQKQIRQLYLPQYEEHLVTEKAREESHSPLSPRENGDNSVSWSRPSSANSDNKKSSAVTLTPREIGALEIAAEQLRVWPTKSRSQQEEAENNEESTVFSQAIHYANRMVYLRVPLDASRSPRSASHFDGENSSTVTASIGESDSYDAESGFDESESPDVATTVTKFVTRFVDKVCAEGGVTAEHIKSLHQMVPGVIAMHLETLEAVSRESKRLPPIQKPKILTPVLLPGEEMVMDGLRAYLLQDGREEGLGGNLGGPSLIPAEGAIFLTTYRVIFKGTPCDPIVCEQVVMRCFPVSTLTKEKKMGTQYLQHLDQWLHEGLQLRSNIFQMIKVAFDEEVDSESVETLRKLMNRVRNPHSVFSTFAFMGHASQQVPHMHKDKEKHATLRHIYKRTLLKTARKVGLRPKQSQRKQKYVLPTPPPSRRNTSPRSSDSESDRPSSEVFDELSFMDEGEIVVPSLSSDPKNVERLMERPSYQDYQRLGLGSLSSLGQRSRSEPFRLSTVNATYSVCRSYPALLAVPQSISDESIRKFARCHRQSRFPVITWRHPRTKALLLRASGFHSRGPIGMLSRNPGSGTSSGEASSSLEQQKYFKQLVAATPISNRTTYTTQGSDSLTSLDSLMMVGLAEPLRIPDTPEQLRRNMAHSSAAGPSTHRTGIPAHPKPTSPKEVGSTAHPQQHGHTTVVESVSRTVGRLRASMGKGRHKPASLSRMGSLRDKGGMSPPMEARRHNGTLDSRGDLINSSVQGLHCVILYVLGEKNQMKNVKVDAFPDCDFIPVDFYEVRHIKASFKKLMRACCPSRQALGSEQGYLKSVQDSEWLPQLQNILQLSGAVVDLVDVQGASVMVCLEDGWDITAQVVSVAEVLLDPYYRTLEGFKALVEKEWLAFGHRFTHRSNQTAANQASGFAPVFLQFLDIVHQIHRQFPLSFEFNQYFLKFIAYHYVSNRFRTFMLDNEFERVEAGWLLDEKRPGGVSVEEVAEGQGFSPKHSLSQGSGFSGLWDYVDKQHRKSAIFTNFLFSPHDQDTVLRPYANVSNLVVWDYYVTEDLAHGPSFDVELVDSELRQNTDMLPDTAATTADERRIILNSCYDNITLQQPDFFRHQFREIQHLESELGHLPQKWKVQWDKLEVPGGRESSQRQPSLSMQLVRSHGRSIHKRSTLEILVRGKMLGEAARMFSQPHRFEKFTYTTPTYCDFCQQLLWGFSKTGTHCTECGYNCHEKCQSLVPKTCSKLKSVTDTSAPSAVSVTRGGVGDVTTTASGTGASFETFSPPSHGEHRTHEGYLYKQGAFFKQWKQRWFVLDSMKHQLRYYDAMEDSNYRGFIDLAEVESVQPVKIMPGAPKKADENSFIEVRTVRRTYNFMAMDAKSAHEWIDKLQSCLQS
ncbi:myotubularin-related protein 13-like isoform X2 [Babylonia areolata]|uniref:myotubularin-related protein 13-like isoform X2 n=1 Tax=Babylonia areolata TaxID=304850 RepID=UPI003FD68973